MALSTKRRKKVVYQTLVTEHLSLDERRRLHEITTAWPSVDRINHRLASYMTDALPSSVEGVSLLSKTVSDAIKAWDKNNTFNDLFNFGAYVNVLIKSITLVYRFEVHTPFAVDEYMDGSEVWDPMLEGLDQWNKRIHNTSDVVIAPAQLDAPIEDKHTLRRMLSGHILSTSDIRILSEYIKDIYSDNFMADDLNRELNVYVSPE